jgi:hypothetical protein
MKNVTMRLTIAAAAFVAVAGVASAQTMEAKIPFSFRANGKVFTAGTYRVSMRQVSTTPLILIRSQDSGQGALAVAMSTDTPKQAWTASGNAVLSFECGVSRCALSELWMGSSTLAYRLSVPKLGKDEPRRTAEIVLRPVGD